MFKKFLNDRQVERRYVNAGAVAGVAISYIVIAGECVGFQSSMKRWAHWEKEYARRGYRTISADSFVSYGGYGKPLVGLGVRRDENEVPVFHALEW